MPNFTANLNITTGRGDKLIATKTGNYTEVFNIRQQVDNANAFVAILAGGSSKAIASINDCKSMIIKNTGLVGGEIKVIDVASADGTPDTSGSARYKFFMLGAGEFIYFPNIRQMSGSGANSTANSVTLDNQVPNANMYIALNNVAAGDAQLVAEAIDGSETEIDVDEGAYFYVGDLIRVGNEVMEVTGISSNTLTVIRASHGSSAASHSDDTAIRMPFFNAYGGLAYNRYSVAQTDSNGNFMATNFFGYGRNTDGSGNRESNGIVAGSVAIKFYEAGYQNMTNDGGITAGTNSGLSASTTYYLSIAQNGGSTDAITFTTDSSNVNFGGTNGIISKLQDAVDALVYDPSKNGYEDGVIFSIVQGNLRCTSKSHLSTSAISITTNTAGTAGTDELFDTSNVIGRFPATIPSAVAAKLPPDTIIDKKSGLEIQNISKMAYDDSFGNIRGVCGGSINYETGAITLLDAPRNAEMVVSGNYGSSQSGGNRFSTDDGNSITSIQGRSCNSKIDTTIEIIGLK